MKKFLKVSCLTAAVSALAVPCFAAMTVADETAIKAGLSASDSIFYTIGGAILVVLAGIWGFKKVQHLIG
jgi:hypothetical protein